MEKIWNSSIKALSEKYSWVADMHGVPQSVVHHTEGDVAIHTQMVLDELVKLEAYQNMDIQDQQVLWMSALLHDVEKRSTTFTDENGNIVSPGHAKKGALTAREILFTAFSIPFKQREQIVQLVRRHGLPLWLMEKPNPQHSLIKTSLSINMEWVHTLATADVLGRICSDKNALLEKLAFFEAYCREQNAWHQPYPFATAAARFHYCNISQQSSPGYIPFAQPAPKVVLVCGLPGMGKDFYIQQHLKDEVLISLDDVRKQHKLKPTDKSANGWVAQQAKEKARECLRSKTGFVWNATCITKQMRSQLIELFSSYGAYVHIVYIEKPYKKWQQQNLQRNASVPVAVLNKMLSKLEVPTADEAHEVSFITE